MKIDAGKVKDYLIENTDKIGLLLEHAGFDNIHEIRNEYRCAWAEGLSADTVKVNILDLHSAAYSMDIKGDIIHLIQEKKKLPFVTTLKYICEVCGINGEMVKPKYDVTLPFGAYFKKIGKIKDDDYIEITTYSNDYLELYGIVPNMQFYKDGISIETMEKFKCGYDTLTNRWTVNWRDIDENLIGIMGRINGRANSNEPKWFPIIPFQKSHALFGLFENKQEIKEKKTIVIFESEKSVMQCDTFGFNCAVALGGNSLSRWQVNTIRSLFPDKIIIALDQDLPVEHSIKLANQLKLDGMYSNTVQYIQDVEGKYLRKGRKESPSDLGKDVFQKLLSECTYDL